MTNGLLCMVHGIYGHNPGLIGAVVCLFCAVIKIFCSEVGASKRQAQGVIRLAKKNGEKLGFLA